MKFFKLLLAGILLSTTSTLVWAGKSLLEQENIPPQSSTNVTNKISPSPEGTLGSKKSKTTHKRKNKRQRDAARKLQDRRETSLSPTSKVSQQQQNVNTIPDGSPQKMITFVPENLLHESPSVLPMVIKDVVLLGRYISNLQEKLEIAHKKVNIKDILEVYNAFSSTGSPMEVWKAYREEHRIYQWPRQDDKQAIGAHLFFPKWTHEWADNFAQVDFLKRRDMLQAFAIGAKLHHPLSQYYLVNTLQAIRSDFTDVEMPETFHKLYEQAFEDLGQCTDHPDACYILGWSSWRYPYLLGSNGEKAFTLHTKGKDSRNQFQALEIRDAQGGQHSSSLRQATVEDYLEVAKEGYGPAYLKAAELAEGFDTKLGILIEAREVDYAPALIEMGYLYNLQKKTEEEYKCYEAAAQAGISEGYIALGKMYVGDTMSMPREKVKALSKKQIEKGEHFFKLAGETQDPNGWDCLADLYITLLANNRVKKGEEKAYGVKIYQALEKGIALGSAKAYQTAAFHFPKELPLLIETYGYPPQDLRARFVYENFIKNES